MLGKELVSSSLCKIISKHALILLCFFVLYVFQLMSHRDEVLFYQEIKFRNKLVEYLSDWVALASSDEVELPNEITVNSR